MKDCGWVYQDGNRERERETRQRIEEGRSTEIARREEGGCEPRTRLVEGGGSMGRETDFRGTRKLSKSGPR
jgi:hypothetical protein